MTEPSFSQPEVSGSDSALGSFFREWLRQPAAVGAALPSGRALARATAAAVPVVPRPRVIELGAGTGVITRALLARGIAPEDLLVVEHNPAFVELLQTQFPQVPVVQGDALRLHRVVTPPPSMAPGPWDAVVSGLPLLNMSARWHYRILSHAFRVLGPEGRFIQFTYGFRPPAHGRVCRALGLRVRSGAIAFRNFPPARLYLYERQPVPGH